MNRFEQLIEYVINDEEQKARELFHEIVVEKSRQIYEDIMSEEAEEELDEAKEEELDEGAEEELDEGAEEELDEGAEEELDEAGMGGDASDKLIDDVEMEEESEMNMEAESDDMDMEGGAEPATKDDIQDIKDTLDQLMAEFDSIMGDKEEGDGDDFEIDAGGDAIEMDDTEEMGDEEEMDEVSMHMAEALELKAAPKPVTAEQGDGKAGPVTFNSGKAGMAASPVHATGGEEKGRPAPTAKDMGATPTQDAGKKAFKSAAPAPVKTQAAGVNTRSPLPRG